MKFDLKCGIEYLYCGIFTSPADGWKHMDRLCDSCELFILTDGILYINADGKDYTVKKKRISLNSRKLPSIRNKNIIMPFLLVPFSHRQHRRGIPEFRKCEKHKYG